MVEMRQESDGLGLVEVPADKLWGAQTQRSLEHFSIGADLIPREMNHSLCHLEKCSCHREPRRQATRRSAVSIDRSGLRRDLGRRASRDVSPACLDDRQRHPIQHERQRGDLQSLLSNCRHAARQQDTGASKRSRQYGPVVQRLVSICHVYRGGRKREGANLKKINEYVERSLMLVTALSPVIGYDKASKIAHFAMDNDLTLKQAALKLGFWTEAEFDRVVDPEKMVTPYVATAAA